MTRSRPAHGLTPYVVRPTVWAGEPPDPRQLRIEAETLDLAWHHACGYYGERGCRVIDGEVKLVRCPGRGLPDPNPSA